MAILSTPTPSTSFRSWQVTAGSLALQLCLQSRSIEGLVKNKKIGHRLKYKRVDFAKYRIIYSRNPVDFASENMRREHVEKKSTRMVLAVANEIEEILKDWENIKTVWEEERSDNESKSSGEALNIIDKPLSVEQWKVLCERMKITAALEVDIINCNGSVTEGETINSSSMSETILQEEVKDEEDEEEEEEQQLKDEDEIFKEEEDNKEKKKENDQNQNKDGKELDAYDIFLIRIINLWYWQKPIETIIYISLIFIMWIFGVLYWPILFIITIFIGLPWFRQPVNSKEQDKGRLLLCWLENLLGWKNYRCVLSSFASLILIEYIFDLILPKWQKSDVVEFLLPPLIIISLLYSGIKYFLNSSVEPEFVVEKKNYEESDNEKKFNISLINQIEENEVKKIEDLKEIKEIKENITVSLPSLDEDAKILRKQIAPEGPFSNIILRTIEFTSESNGWIKRKDRRDGLIIYEKRSCYSNKTCILITTKIPNTNVGSLQHLLLDDPNFEDKKTTYAYQYDKYLSSRQLIKVLGGNEFVILSRYKSPGWGTAPREVLNYVSSANLFTPTQQEALRLRSFNNCIINGKELMAFAQCGIHCPENDVQIPPEFILNKVQRIAAHIYFIMGMEEVDNSLTLRVCFDLDLGKYIPTTIQEYINIGKVESIVKLLSEIGPKPNITRPYVNAIDFFPLLKDIKDVDSNKTENIEVKTSDENKKEEEEKKVSSSSFNNDNSTDKEVIRIAKKFVQELLLRNWQMHSEKKGVSLWTTTTPWSDKKAVKTVTFIPGVTLQNIDDVLNDMNLTLKLDKSIKSKSITKNISNLIKIFDTKFHSPMWGIAARDMITRVVTSYYPKLNEYSEIGLNNNNNNNNNNNELIKGPIFLQIGEDATEEVPITNNYQRGHVFVFGILAEEKEDKNGNKGVQLIKCVAVDPGGSLPNAIVDAAVTLQIENTLSIVENVKKRATLTKKGGVNY